MRRSSEVRDHLERGDVLRAARAAHWVTEDTLNDDAKFDVIVGRIFEDLMEEAA